MSQDADARVRAATFTFLETEVRRRGTDVLPRALIGHGFLLDGQRVPIVGPSGIFKPAVLPEVPLSITTVPVEEGEARPYHDVVGDDGLLRYCYRGTDPSHRDNVGLRLAMKRQAPLVYCHGVVRVLYVVVWPVFIVGDDPPKLTFTVSVDDRSLASLGNREADERETDGRRRYVTRQVQQRLHQEGFRQRVLAAYHSHCAVCRLQHEELLEAAHILPDGHPQGQPIVPNGLVVQAAPRSLRREHSRHRARLSDRDPLGRARREGRPDAEARAAGISRAWLADAAPRSAASQARLPRGALRHLQEGKRKRARVALTEVGGAAWARQRRQRPTRERPNRDANLIAPDPVARAPRGGVRSLDQRTGSMCDRYCSPHAGDYSRAP